MLDKAHAIKDEDIDINISLSWLENIFSIFMAVIPIIVRTIEQPELGLSGLFLFQHTPFFTRFYGLKS